MSQAVHALRNTGVIAHIDAGKTTLSERMLFYTQKIHRMGEVHNGTATMDYLPEEQERGITITSACTTCLWNAHTINLIDTPGHVDFTIEVERSLRVLDGAVGVFCAVGGVEPQSETVWRQSEQFGVPKLAFINKMDRIGAHFSATLDAIRTRLGANPVAVNIPVGEAEQFSGIIDLIDEVLLTFAQDDQGQTITRTPLADYPDLNTIAAPWRERLLEAVAENDDAFMEAYLNAVYTVSDVHAALRRVTLQRLLTPVFCGSALRNIGIQPLLDAICAYLPAPSDLPPVPTHTLDGELAQCLPCDANLPFMGLVFKVLMDAGRKIAFVRVYAGSLKEGDVCRNITRKTDERVARLYRLHADRREQISQAQAGEIVAVVGLRSAITGDTVATHTCTTVLEPINVYKPVINLALEPRNADEGKALDEALARICLEDPTILVELDEGSGHRVVSGMGELHLEVVLERIQREYGINPRAGNPQVVKRETPTRSAEAEAVFDRELGKQAHHGQVALRITPCKRNAGSSVAFACNTTGLSPAFQQALLEGIENALQSGPRTGYPLQDIAVSITAFQKREGESTAVGFHMAAGNAMRQALNDADVAVLEPLMLVEISVPENALGSAISLFGARNGKVDDLTERAGMKIVRGVAPLSKLFGFSTDLRSATQGRAGLVMRFERFDTIDG